MCQYYGFPKYEAQHNAGKAPASTSWFAVNIVIEFQFVESDFGVL
jgi:hypothetical protein